MRAGERSRGKRGFSECFFDCDSPNADNRVVGVRPVGRVVSTSNTGPTDWSEDKSCHQTIRPSPPSNKPLSGDLTMTGASALALIRSRRFFRSANSKSNSSQGLFMSASHEVTLINCVVADFDPRSLRSSSMERHATTSKREIAFIDRGVDDLATLLAGMRADVEPILLSNDEAAPRQMARAIEGRDGLEAIHVIAHGRSGEVSFGAGPLSNETIADHTDDLARLGLALGDEVLQLWTCHTAEGERGVAFVEALALATGARLAASTRRVGAAARGGRWSLDIGSPDVVPLSAEGAANYPGVLATSTTINDNNTSGDLTLSTTTTNATVNLNNSSGDDSVTTDGSGSTTVNGNNSSGDDTINITNASSATVNLNNSTGNDDVDISGTTVNATVNDNNSGLTGGTDEIDIAGTAVSATVNLNNSVGNDALILSARAVLMPLSILTTVGAPTTSTSVRRLEPPLRRSISTMPAVPTL